MTKRLENLLACFRAGRNSRHYYNKFLGVDRQVIASETPGLGMEYRAFIYGGTHIATYCDGKLEIKTGPHGWSKTTRNYLNGVLALFGLPQLYQKHWDWYFDGGEEFTGYKKFENVRFAA